VITGLRFGAAPVTAGERDELCAVLTALGMPGERVDALTARTSAAVVATNS
jgi:hypothetical protein